MSKLVVLDGISRGKVFLLRSRNIIGRHSECSFLLKDKGISGKHCKIDQVGSNVFNITDLDSSNGTFVNNKTIISTALNFGDIITLGNIRILFQPTAKLDGDSTIMIDMGEYMQETEQNTHCGRPTAKEWNFCPYCGQRFAKDSIDEE